MGHTRRRVVLILKCTEHRGTSWERNAKWRQFRPAQQLSFGKEEACAEIAEMRRNLERVT
eukprot:3056644-Rhodomonas_salina.2